MDIFNFNILKLFDSFNHSCIYLLSIYLFNSFIHALIYLFIYSFTSQCPNFTRMPPNLTKMGHSTWTVIETTQVSWPFCLISLGLGGIGFTLKVWQAMRSGKRWGLASSAWFGRCKSEKPPLRCRDRFASLRSAWEGLDSPWKSGKQRGLASDEVWQVPFDLASATAQVS